jgi:hypothetical protein
MLRDQPLCDYELEFCQAAQQDKPLALILQALSVPGSTDQSSQVHNHPLALLG